MSMPSLVYVLGLSGAVHIVNYYREAVKQGGVAGAPERALGHGWFPCTLAAFTTALGLGSLCTSNLTPISKFGWYSAIGALRLDFAQGWDLEGDPWRIHLTIGTPLL